MKLVKCKWCKEKYEKDKMVCEERDTGKKLKNGNPKVLRSYFHKSCHREFKKEQEFKEKEAFELKELYDYLLDLHKINSLDGRMMEKIQDLRNGTIKVNNRKFKKYKQGIEYKYILSAYKENESSIEWGINNKSFQNKYNEFAYCFSIMLNNVNDTIIRARAIEKKEEEQQKLMSETIDSDKVTKAKPLLKKATKKDELDISNFL